MVKQPSESRYVKDSNRFNKMKEVYEMYHIQHLLVTKIGCSIAGFREEQIAPLFAEAVDVKNIILPREFVEIIENR